ncbi:PP2C family protein-serine/threonine phosphatase [Actinopolymorpha singaporensis]|uniref:Serine/threonine protein phosphatase PrpC n=1 Tax=Actinopolymorpha singaporensis TaxID=117157 RepID=A0A1H1S4Q1_9ACTN|nr:protein phosphatase 2C domain-containing protein [Actinopolymorpha singaporensis]SDS42931.1 Serine/threonine protein phosphatase PrpC [Actinopolymorpha singaporensis]
MRFTYSVRTHVGLVRGNNEDSAFAGPHLLLVADGVGGHAAGEVASASVAHLFGSMSLLPKPAPGESTTPGADLPDLSEVLRGWIDRAHRLLVEGVAADPAREGMATTLTAVLTDGHTFAMAHAGDSRAYVLRDGTMRQVSVDHTLVQSLLDQGRITPAQARVHPYRSAVTRFVDGGDRPDADIVLLDLQPGDRLLLCSDGLTDFVDEDEIRSCLVDATPEEATDNLVRAALVAGGRDNVTCVVGDVLDGDLMPWHRRPYFCRMEGAVTDLANLIDPAGHGHAA